MAKKTKERPKRGFTGATAYTKDQFNRTKTRIRGSKPVVGLVGAYNGTNAYIKSHESLAPGVAEAGGALTAYAAATALVLGGRGKKEAPGIRTLRYGGAIALYLVGTACAVASYSNLKGYAQEVRKTGS
jgi:hypothetical protein